MIKKINYNSMFALVLVFTFAAGLSAAENTWPPKGNVALVNGQAITGKEVLANYHRLEQNFLQRGGRLNDTSVEEMRMRAVRGVVNEELLYQESRKAGITVENSDVQEQLTAFKNQFPSQEQYHKALNDGGLTEADFEVQIKKSLSIQAFVKKQIIDNIKITESEKRAYYDDNPKMFNEPERVRASHILIKVADGGDEAQKMAARKRIAEINQKLNNGGDFAELAKAYSEDPSSETGGDLGYLWKGKMDPAFENAAFSLKPGQVKDMVLTSSGYHIIKVTDRKPGKVFTFEEAEKRIAQQLKKDRVNRQVERYIETLRSKAKIKML